MTTIWGVFVLPFAFPPGVPTYSSTYTLGFDNRVAALMTVLLSLCVFAMQTLLKVGPRPSAPDPRASAKDSGLPGWAVGLACLAAASFSLWLGLYWIHSDKVFDDGSYILNQLLRGLHDRAALYREIEWPYGPLLFYGPAATAHLLSHAGVGAWWSYVLTLAWMQALGVALLGYLLNELPLSKPMRGAGLLLLTLGTLLPILGINYTLLRFLLPHALLLFTLHVRSVWGQVVLFALGGALAMSVSPELGIALLAGVIGYALYRAWDGRQWLWSGMIGAPIVGLAAFSASMSRDYFAVMRSFANGGFNLLVEPRPHIFVLLMAAIVLAPLAVAPAVGGRRNDAGKLTGLYLCSLAMLGSAFGRADPLHAFYSGLGLYLSALVTADRVLARTTSGQRRFAAAAWVALFAAAVAMEVDDKTVGNREQLQAIFAGPDGQREDLRRIETMLDGARISAPVSLPWAWREELTTRDQLVPSFSFEMRGTWDAPGIARKLEEMRAAPFTLIPERRYVWEYQMPDESRRARVLRLGYVYRRKHPSFVPGVFIARELYAHWEPVGRVDGYTLYRRQR